MPAYIHFALNAGADDSRTVDWPLAKKLAAETETPFINVHLAPRQKDFPVHPNDRAVIDRLVADVNRLGDFFGMERVIVENIPFGNPEEAFAPIAIEPSAIAEVIDRTGAGLLLDLSHARLTARHLKIDERKYVSALPVKYLRELHLTGIQPWEGRERDHMHFSKEDWAITQWALDQIAAGSWARPRMVALEYGGLGGTFEWRSDPKHMAEQVPRLYEMVHTAID